MANQYDAGLEKTPANYQPLTPLVFLERAAQALALSMPRASTAVSTPLTPRFTLALASSPPRSSPRHRRRRYRLGDARQYAGHARGALRRAHDGRRAPFHQHETRCECRCLHAGPCRHQGADRRHRVRLRAQAGAETGQGEATSDRLSRPAVRRGRDTAG